MMEKFLATGGACGALAAAAASSCCMVPLALTSVGVGGAWIGTFAAMAPYQPVFLAVAVVFLGGGFWMVYGRRRAACATGAGRLSASVRWVKVALWFGAAAAALTVGVDASARLVP